VEEDYDVLFRVSDDPTRPHCAVYSTLPCDAYGNLGKEAAMLECREFFSMSDWEAVPVFVRMICAFFAAFPAIALWSKTRDAGMGVHGAGSAISVYRCALCGPWS
jgi:hypothetical protein